MKLTLTKEVNDEGEDRFVIRSNGTYVVGKLTEPEGIKAFEKCVEAYSKENKPILIREVEI